MPFAVAELQGKRIREALRNPHAFAFIAAHKLGWQPLLELVVSNPRTFNQKVRYRMVHDRREILATFADKLASKLYVSEVLGADHVPRLIASGSASTAIDPTVLPREYALKVSHASGGVLLVSEAADPDARLPDPGGPFVRLLVHPDNADFRAMAPIVDAWLQRPYSDGIGEWAYSQLSPSVLVEEYLRTPDGGPPPDLKFFVFDGSVQMMRIDVPGRGKKSLNHYLPDGTPIKVRFAEYHTEYFPEPWPAPELPSAWREALNVAERLGRGIDFVRVDTFQVGERVLVGELTNYPTNGTARYSPRSIDRWLGSKWNLAQFP